MKSRQNLWLASCGMVGVALILTHAAIAQVTYPQVTPRVTETDRATTADVHSKVCKASDVIGMNVRSTSGDENIGSINDLVIADKNGRISYAAVSFGGFLGMGDKLFAVPLEAIEFVKNDDDSYARIDVTEETLKDKRGFDQDNWPTEADSSFINSETPQQAATSSSAPR